MWISELKEQQDLPKEFLDVLPEVCECGSELVISPSLTGLHCPNPYCLSKVVKRAEAMLSEIGVLGMGEKSLEKFFETYRTRNPLALFALEIGDLIFDGASEDVSEKIISQLNDKKEMFLWQLVKIANLPGIQTTAKTLLSDYSDIEEFYKDLEFGSIDFIKDKLGLSYENDVMASKIYNSLITYKEDLLNGVRFVNLKVLRDVKEVEICISEGVFGFKSKNDFVDTLNKEFGDKYFFINNSSLTKKASFLVWEGGRVTSKAKTAERYGTKIIKGKDLIEFLRNGGLV